MAPADDSEPLNQSERRPANTDGLDRDWAAGPPRLRFVLSALFFELSLGGAALTLGWLIGYDPLRRDLVGAISDPEAALIGAAAAIPPLVALAYLQRRTSGRLRAFVEYCDRHLVPIFRPLSVLELALLSVAAGIGEELLFRGLLLGCVAHWWGGSTGLLLALVASSLLFGVCHFLTRTYAILATLAGLYLGLVFVLTDHLLAPIVAHAGYDLGALILLTKKRRPE